MIPKTMSIFVYGSAHAGKTTLAASFEPPILHIMLDTPGKEFPFSKYGASMDTFCEKWNVPCLDIYAAIGGGAVLRSRTELWQWHEGLHDENGYQRLINRIRTPESQWKTVVLDSTSAFASLVEWHSRNYAKNEKGKPVADGRQHYGFVGSTLKMVFYNLLPMWPAKFKLVVGHVRGAESANSRAEGVTGDMLRIPDLPGALKGNFSGAFTEVWRAYGTADGGRAVQTFPDGRFLASTNAGVPDNIVNDWNVIKTYLE